MEDKSPNRLHEARTTFKHEGAVVAPARLTQAKTYRAKVFKSGNSLALRLPSALGLEAGIEMELTVNPAGGYSLKLAEAPRRKIDISGFAGKAPGIKLAPREDFEERPSTIAARKAAGLA
jgi:antitoxin VapB